MKKSEREAVDKFLIVTVNNEQKPFIYPNTRFCTEGKPEIPKSHGDYTIEYDGKIYLDKIIVERKGNVSELYAATGKDRERWEKELENLSKVDVAIVLCEFSYMDILNKKPDCKILPTAVYNSICSWNAVYGIAFVFCENRVNARNYLYRLFQSYTKHVILGVK